MIYMLLQKTFLFGLKSNDNPPLTNASKRVIELLKIPMAHISTLVRRRIAEEYWADEEYYYKYIYKKMTQEEKDTIYNWLDEHINKDTEIIYSGIVSIRYNSLMKNFKDFLNEK